MPMAMAKAMAKALPMAKAMAKAMAMAKALCFCMPAGRASALIGAVLKRGRRTPSAETYDTRKFLRYRRAARA